MEYLNKTITNCSISANDRGSVWKVSLVLGLVFVLNPFIGVMVTLFFSFVSREKSIAPFTVVLLALFMWCLQSTRTFNLTEHSDWAGNYYYNFHNAGNIDLVDYLLFTGKEYAWQAFNLIGYYLFDGDFLPYGNFIVMLTYAFTFTAIYKFWNYTKTDTRFLIVSLCLFAFISEINALSNNLLRQQFAMSMMLYVIVEKCTTGRIFYPLMLIALFTHSMTGLFIPSYL